MNKKNNYYLAIFFILLSAIGFSSLQMIVKLLPNTGLASKIFYRNIVITLIVYIVIKFKKLSLKVEKTEWKFLTLRIFFGLLGVAINFYAISFVFLADSTTIQKTSSFMMMLLSYLFFKEKFDKIQFIAIILSFFGVILIVKPGSDVFSLGHIYVILGTLCATFAYLSIRALGIRKKIHPLLIVFYFSLFGALTMIPFILKDRSIFEIKTLLLLISIGIFGAIGQFGITFAYNLAPSKEISVFEYTQVVFSSILGMIFLNEFPDLYSILGYLVIITIGIFMFNYNKKKEKFKDDKRNIIKR